MSLEDAYKNNKGSSNKLLDNKQYDRVEIFNLKGIQSTGGGGGGPPGPPGPTGPQGPQGIQGIQGKAGGFGGATFHYKFDTNTNPSLPTTPTQGYLRLNNSIQDTSDNMYINIMTSNGVNIESF